MRLIDDDDANHRQSDDKCDATHKSVVVAVYFGEYERPLLGTVGDVHAIEHRLVLHFAVEMMI